MLNAGGRFISGDMFVPEREFEKEIYKKNWINLMLSNGLSLPEAENMIAPLDDFCDSNTILSFSKKLEEAGFSPSAPLTGGGITGSSPRTGEPPGFMNPLNRWKDKLLIVF